MIALEVEGLKKSFGKVEVLKDVTFKAVKGNALGFIGKNGAGKTTTMKIILGLMGKDKGSIKIENTLIDSYVDYKGIRIGYLPDVPEFYSYMKPLEYLRLCGNIIGLEKDEIEKEAEELMELSSLKEANKKIGGFSRGMKQRLGIAQALLGKPDILICDEPTSALDPIGRHDILKLMKKIKSRTTIIFSTHILADVEEVCDDIAILDQGKIMYCGGMKELKDSYIKENLKIECYSEKDIDIIDSLGFSNRKEGKVMIIDLSNDGEAIIDSIWKVVHDNRTDLKGFTINTLTLEDIFMEMTK